MCSVLFSFTLNDWWWSPYRSILNHHIRPWSSWLRTPSTLPIIPPAQTLSLKGTTHNIHVTVLIDTCNSHNIKQPRLVHHTHFFLLSYDGQWTTYSVWKIMSASRHSPPIHTFSISLSPPTNMKVQILYLTLNDFTHLGLLLLILQSRLYHLLIAIMSLP